MSRCFTFLLVLGLTYSLFPVNSVANAAGRQNFAPSGDDLKNETPENNSKPAQVPVFREVKADLSKWCQKTGGDIGVKLPDGTPVDCMTDQYVIELEDAQNWAIALGRSRYAANVTGREPGVVLFMEDTERQVNHLLRLLVAIQGDLKDWKVWVISPD